MSPAEQKIQKEFSQRWEVYRIATHELGGISFVRDVEKCSLKQLHDMLEILDVHDALKQIAYKKAEQEAKQNK